MKDTVYQVRRALQSKGFLMAICLMLYSLFFIHTDAPTFFTMPLTYFRKDCTFYYHFIVSFWMGLSQYIIPIAAMLPLCFFLCEDQESRYHNLAAYRLPQGRYLLHRTIAAVLSAMMAVFLACVLFTGFLLLVCTTKGGGQEAWLLNRHDSAFAWLATTDHFLWFILAQYARLMLSAAIWAVAAVMFSLLWANKAFVFVATYGSSILLDVALGRYLGSEYSLSTLQTPDLNTATPLFTLFARQMMIFFVILALYLLVLFFSSSTKVAKINQKGQQFLARHLKPQILVTEWNLSRQICGTWRGRLLTDTRIFLTKATLIPAIIIPALVMFSKRVIQTPVHSIGDLWLDVFGGFYWFEPQINFTPIGLWILLLLPPMMGVALTLEQELRSRVQTTMHRFQTKMHWWASKCCAILIYTFTCTIVMFLSVATIGWLTGATGFGVLMEDADGFLSEHYAVLLQTFLLFLGQVLMLTQLQAVIHMATGRIQPGVIAYILPCLVCLITCSIFDRLGNVYIPYNWGMILRSTLFSPSFMYLDTGNSSPLCAIDVKDALIAQGIMILVLIGINLLVVRAIHITQREVKN